MPKKTTKKLVKKTKKATLGMVAIVKDIDVYFLPEWLHFHRLAGVQKFYLVAQSKGLDRVIKKTPFAEDISVVTGTKQTAVEAYRVVMQQFKDEVDWMVLADVDEFFFNVDGENLQAILMEYEQYDCGGVIVYRKDFGLSGHVDRPSLPITDHLVLAFPPSCNSCYKVIVRTDAYTGCDNEWFFNVSKPYVNQDGTDFKEYGYVASVTPTRPQRITCHHYFVRGVEDVISRYCRHRNDSNYKTDMTEALQWSYAADLTNIDATLYSQEIKTALNIKGANATPDNTVFVSVADYEHPEKATKLLTQSAEEYGVEIHWASWGAEWHSFIKNKVRRMLECLQCLQADGTKYAFVLDSADVLFTQPLQSILNTFNRIYNGGVLFNSDYCDVMWPLEDPMLKWYINTNYGKNSIANAGCYCGEIPDIISLLELILDVREQIKSKDYRQLCTKLFAASASCSYENKIFDSTGKLIDDDQWLLHILMTEYNPLIKVDKYKQMFALIENFSDKPESVYVRNCTGTAAIWHISHILKGIHE